MEIIQKLLKVNHNEGRKGYVPMCVVIHVADGDEKSVYQTFKNPNNQKSSHYLVDYNGTVIQYVLEENTAWGNGIKAYPSAQIIKDNIQLNPNLISISIEHAGYGTKDITEVQYKATSELVKEICQRWNIPLDRRHIIGHKEIYRWKSCPGKINIEKIISLASPTNPQKDDIIIKELKQKQLSLLQKLLKALQDKLAELTKGRV